MAEKANIATKANDKDKEQPAVDNTLLPPVDVIEDSAGITLLADLPGVSKDKLNLQLDKNRLTIEGEVGLELPQAMQSTHAEVRQPRYRRVFTLSSELDSDKATAELKNGVLKLHIPKASHAQPRRIQINVA